MFSNRRKRVETNKIIYHNNRVSTQLLPMNHMLPFMKTTGNDKAEEKIEIQITINENNSENVGIGTSNPQVALDVSGTVNTSDKFTINYVSIAPPVGSIMAYTMSSSPEGWLLCVGTSVSKDEYPELFKVIGTTFGGNDTTFNLPDYRGAFLRGSGSDVTGNYTGPELNASQGHATQTHTHNATSIVTDRGHTHIQSSANGEFTNSEGNTYPSDSNPSFAGYDGVENKSWSNIGSSNTGISVSTNIENNTTNVNTNETRPYNYGVYWIIKY